ncbi:MAG: LysR family transcriptional regulator [Eubacteriales bacterium]|nr:LysR family transcriptional regulator [Clostridiales bacterium]MDD6371902.1 LysR family transcriptional regulator [Eubacteriales bacterium]MDD7259888.1 LysR family transcriptional regulator [Eubacteriales bacterium]MDY6066634.1 LysR family transcriptional regulator [Candidatus Faecousia sp.]
MNMKQALYFKTIAQYGTITAAAKQLYISQPSLSQTLRQIEDEVGTPLFDRSTSPFHLTYAGERYLKAVEAMLDIETRLKEEIESIRRDDGGRLRLGISVTRAMQVLPDVIPIFTKAYPNVTIELTEAASASLEGLLQKGQIDLALAALEANEANIAYELIEKESIGILAGKDSQLAQLVPSGTPISLEMVEKEAFVSLDTSHSSRIIQDRLFRRYNIRPKILLETSSLEVARRVALKSGACMVLPDVYADEFVFNSGGAFYPLKDYENHRHFYACYRNDENTKKYIRDFVSITTSVLNQTTHGKRI